MPTGVLVGTLWLRLAVQSCHQASRLGNHLSTVELTAAPVHHLAAAARFELDQVKKEFNALNKQIAELRKVWCWQAAAWSSADISRS
jgi:hypothetical protein